MIIAVLLGAWNTDDGYHGFVMARNFAEGRGLVYNIGERVNAATCPLFVLLTGCAYFMFGHMEAVSIVICTCCFSAAAGILLFRICQQRWQVLLAAVLLGTSVSFVSFTTSGLENSLLFLEEALFLQLLFANDTFDFKRLLHLALLCSLVLTTRMDAGILLFAVTAYCFLAKRSCSMFKMAAAGIAGLSPFFLWEIFSFLYYGSPFPNTYDIKLNTGFPLSEYLVRGISYVFESFGFDMAVVVFPVIAACMLLREQMKLKLLGAGIILKIIYIVRIGGDFMVGRHFADLFFVSVCSILYLGGRKKEQSKQKMIFYRRTLIICTAACLMLTQVTRLISLQYMWPVKNTSTDERAYYYPTLGMIPMILGNLLEHEDTSDRTWISDEVKASIEKGYKGDLLNWASGVLVYKYNRDFYMSDRYGLGDPLLSKLPAVHEKDWRVGHMMREAPEGYKESLITGKNMITDEYLHQYYDILQEVVRGDLFSKDRLKKAAGLFFGKYDDLLIKYDEQKKQKKTFCYWLYSEGFGYDGERIGDYVQVHGNDTESMSGWLTDLEAGVYDISMEYDYPDPDTDGSANELILCVVKDDVVTDQAVLEKGSGLCVIRDVALKEGESMRLALIAGIGEKCNVYRIGLKMKK